MSIGGAIVAMILIYIAYQKFYIVFARNSCGSNQMHVAGILGLKRTGTKAINGDAGHPGPQKIVNDYSNTKAINLAYFYLGIGYLNKGDYRKAIDKFNQLSWRR